MGPVPEINFPEFVFLTEVSLVTGSIPWVSHLSVESLRTSLGIYAHGARSKLNYWGLIPVLGGVNV